MQFYFIRHGQSENNALWARGGPRNERRSDPELTELGHRQVRHLAQFLAQPGTPRELGEKQESRVPLDRMGLTHLYCSPMIRCIETGTCISQALGLPLVVWEHAHELGGIFTEDQETGEQVGLPGHDRDYLRARYKDLVLPDGWGKEGWWNRPFETREQRILRAQCFHRELLRRHGGGDDRGAAQNRGDTQDRVAVISHAGFFNYWMRVVLDWPNSGRIDFRKNNVAITRVDLGDRTVVMYVNRTDFLPPEWVS